MNELNKLKLLYKKYNKSSLKTLLPIYYQHSLYLASAIKTLAKNNSFSVKNFVLKIGIWEQVATCHEVAINSCANKKILVTHENPFGKEKEYSSHPKAKRIGRDLRVKVIWNLLAIILKNNRLYDKLPLLEFGKFQDILCPICNVVMWTAKVDWIIIGFHEDETENFAETINYEFEHGEHEDHMLIKNSMDGWDFDYDSIIEHYNLPLKELLTKSKLDWEYCPDPNMTYEIDYDTILVNLFGFSEFLQGMFNEIEKNSDCSCNVCDN